MAATLAFGGKNPVTGKQVMDAAKVPGVLAVMATAGLYDDSGKWLYHTGLPAKSGVGGGIIAVSPGKFGIAVVSPPLDDAGNSVRAQRAIDRHLERARRQPLRRRGQAVVAVDRTAGASRVPMPSADASSAAWVARAQRWRPRAPRARAATLRPRASTDVVTLANGDRITGEVVAARPRPPRIQDRRRRHAVPGVGQARQRRRRRGTSRS